MAYFRMRGPERRREGGTVGGGYPLEDQHRVFGAMDSDGSGVCIAHRQSSMDRIFRFERRCAACIVTLFFENSGGAHGR